MSSKQPDLCKLIGTTVHVIVDRPVGYQHGNIRYPINYGYIPGMLAGDGQEQDVYILGISHPISTFAGNVIGVICRKNDCEDKLVVAPEGMAFHQAQIAEAVHFQEQYFDSYIIPAFHKSCGVIPYRETDNGREYLIALQAYSHCWSFPKGHMEPEENELQTAMRECKEETGLSAQIDERQTATIEYPVSPFARKQVVFFLGKTDGIPQIPDSEILDFKWVRKDALKDYLFPDILNACDKLLL